MTIKSISAAEYKRSMTPKAKPRRAWDKHLPRRVDANQPAIVKNLRKLGFSVQSLHEVGHGVFDLLVAKHGLNILVEVKDGLKSPSARELTEAQRKFHFAWQGMRCVVTCHAECLRLAEQVGAIIRQLRVANIDLRVTGSKELQYQPRLYQ